jgi:DNA-binding transcriptional regulator YhcF (GntR family)
MRPVRISIDRSSRTSPSEQLVSQVRRAVERGTAPPGTRLPTVRALAEQTGLVPNTVAKAYRRLEADGYLEGRGRAGTFVADDPPPAAEAAESDLDEAARAYVERARSLGADVRGAVEAVRRAGGPKR